MMSLKIANGAIELTPFVSEYKPINMHVGINAVGPGTTQISGARTSELTNQPHAHARCLPRSTVNRVQIGMLIKLVIVKTRMSVAKPSANFRYVETNGNNSATKKP